MSKRALLLDLAKSAPNSPGVYLMREPEGGILYVGKAKNLKNRLTTYFQPAPHEMGRTEMLVGRIDRFDVILTETEVEALILECTLIKKHRPRFNVRLKDDKAYPYLKIQLSRPEEAFPRLEWTRRVQKDGARYFGPFPSAWFARQAMELLTRSFRLRACSDNTFRHRSRPCILFQMGQCSGSCVGEVSQEDYRRVIERVVAILEGRETAWLDGLRAQMEQASQIEDYEQAAEIRDQLRCLEAVTQTQGVLEAGSERDRDVLGLARAEGAEGGGEQAHATVLRIRGGKLISAEHFHLQNTDPGLTESEISYEFLAQYYVDQAQPGKKGVALVPPKEILVSVMPEAETEGKTDISVLEDATGVPVHLPDPEDRTAMQLLNVAQINARHALDHLLAKGKALGGHGFAALEEVQEKLHLQKFPRRMECYDISNIQGQDAVASRVVFIDGAPDKNLYRRYKIRTVEGANDFAMMKEVLSRRFLAALKESEGAAGAGGDALPDLIVVDGGKGQLAQALAVLEELGVQGVPAVGLAKARTEGDFTAKEVKVSAERIFLPNRKNPVILLPHTASYRVLTHLRDEAHRFAVSYHRVVRSKRILGQ
ncbi:excinuclease ABC subunit UvrC [Bdellovibrionota bacterium FG-2]